MTSESPSVHLPGGARSAAERMLMTSGCPKRTATGARNGTTTNGTANPNADSSAARL
jgi:hypothetical protein